MSKSYYRRCYPATWIEVPNARPVTIPEWEHLDLFSYREAGEFVVTEAHTGIWLGWDYTKRVALARARLKLQSVGRLEVDRQLTAEMAVYGQSPRYADEPQPMERGDA